ncbi:hypothetical protein B296_00003266 [Ensete ventricosum]|uniref:Uncharacterized protein n=1 Tax=Ensete ventricosum TaxID=4639 RepID=A0A427B8K2_ENSVE|nr:hypothetical protein B296_00003266 [Ensete ventricosum]
MILRRFAINESRSPQKIAWRKVPRLQNSPLATRQLNAPSSQESTPLEKEQGALTIATVQISRSKRQAYCRLGLGQSYADSA